MSTLVQAIVVTLFLSLFSNATHQGMIIYAQNPTNNNKFFLEVNADTRLIDLATLILEHSECEMTGILPNELIISFADQDYPNFYHRINYRSPLSDIGIGAQSIVEFRPNPRYSLSHVEIGCYCNDDWAETVDVPVDIAIGSSNFLSTIEKKVREWLINQQQNGTNFSFIPEQVPISFSINDLDWSPSPNSAQHSYGDIFQLSDAVNTHFVTRNYLHGNNTSHFAKKTFPRVFEQGQIRATYRRLWNSGTSPEPYISIQGGNFELQTLFNAALQSDVQLWLGSTRPVHVGEYTPSIDIKLDMSDLPRRTLLFTSIE